MALIKMRGTLAVPGEYEYPDGIERKDWEELKAAVQRKPIIPVTYGHTTDGLEPPASLQIGTISQKINEVRKEKNEVDLNRSSIEGELWLYPEKISEKLRSRIDNGEKIPISAGTLLDSVDEDGTQRGIQYTHVAILEGEDPLCPLDKCGFGIRLESKRLMRLEKISEVEPKISEKEPEAAPEPEPTPDAVEEPAPEVPKSVEAPAEQKPEVHVADEQAKEEAPAKKEVVLEPETIIPADLPRSERSKEFEVVDGNYQFVLPIYRQQEDNKKD